MAIKWRNGASTIHKKHPWLLPSLFALCWLLFAAWIASPWIEDMADALSWPVALLVFGGLGAIPGYLAFFLFWSILLDPLEPLRLNRKHWPPLSVLIASYNEEEQIENTLQSIWRSEYPGRLQIWLADDGSSDQTASIASGEKARVMRLPHRGKAEALNDGLAGIDDELLLVVDADTSVFPGSLQRLVARMMQEGPGVGAVAGSLYTGRGNWINNLQHWDYQLGIAAIKRSQSTLGATLVAQGAFSLYRRSFLLGSEPWVRAAGEDIVLSWQMLRSARILFEPTALAQTRPPQTLRKFWRQRVRWARGMIEGLRDSGRHMLGGRSGTRHGVLTNSLFPWVDATYSFVFLPGVVLLLLGNPLFVGLWTLLLLPLQVVLFSFQYWKQRGVFREVGAEWQPLPLAFWGYMLLYQVLLSPAALLGYAKEILGRKKEW